MIKIGSIAGRALDTNLVGPGSGIWSRCVRVRVEMDISCPLVPGFPLERDHLPVLWIPFKFEKLGNFCFGCGMLGHDHRNCQDKGAQVLLSEGVNFGFFGKWLRADNDEFQPGINLDNLLNPNQLAVEATPSASRPIVPCNQSSWIQTALDSWDAMITREERGIRDEPVGALSSVGWRHSIRMMGLTWKRQLKIYQNPWLVSIPVPL